MFGSDTTKGSIRMFLSELTGAAPTIRLVGGAADSTWIDTNGIYTNNDVTADTFKGDGSLLTGCGLDTTVGDARYLGIDSEAVSAESSLVAGSAHGVIYGDSVVIAVDGDTVGWTYFNSAHDTVWTHWLIPHVALDTTHGWTDSALYSKTLQGKDTTWVKSQSGGVSADEVSDTADVVRGEITDTIFDRLDTTAAWPGGSVLLVQGETLYSYSNTGDSMWMWHDTATATRGFHYSSNAQVWHAGSPYVFQTQYYSKAVYDTCATNQNLSVDFDASNNHKVVVGATLDTLTLTNGRDGGRYLVTVMGNASAAVAWKAGTSSVWWPDSAAPTRSGVCNVYSFTYYLDVDEGTGGNQSVYIGEAGANYGPE
jgi:hypothetical protein